ncbi:serine/arginine repetitive matrix 2 [Lysobacter enzymogenes]|uniref:Serine/arginine repetitive matrix 2 n=1 Tax=Lysobacter enzymogenes TaxID=69 RepID=A0A0S2DJB4_LYSEN|nr:serine/arginine repetitive matrix 2 [Lysobacter enzymogenes]
MEAVGRARGASDRIAARAAFASADVPSPASGSKRTRSAAARRRRAPPPRRSRLRFLFCCDTSGLVPAKSGATRSQSVIPAKAGTNRSDATPAPSEAASLQARHSGESRNPFRSPRRKSKATAKWIPAFAGMTARRVRSFRRTHAIATTRFAAPRPSHAARPERSGPRLNRHAPCPPPPPTLDPPAPPRPLSRKPPSSRRTWR